MRKGLIFLILIALVFISSPNSNAEYICGDANSDGKLNVSDAVYIINYVYTGGPAPDPGCCDSDCPPTVTDYDGNVYQTVLIGDQCWMMENLKVTHYRNGDPIPNVTDDTEWENLTTGAYCEYDNDPVNVETYGRIYNWYTVDTSANIAPEGWHVPTDAEWKQLEMYLGMSQAQADDTGWRGTDEGGKLKDTTLLWNAPNTDATNESGFTALPGGSRNYDGFILGMGYSASFWSSTEDDSIDAWSRHLYSGNSQVYRLGGSTRRNGCSVRCVRD